jgi:Domain of unknown function (DUF6438)
MEDDDNDLRAPVHWGDMGALVLAGGFSLLGLALVLTMLFGGHPLAVLFQEAPKPPPRALTQEDWNRKTFTTEPGEIVLSTGMARSVGGSFPAVKDWTSLRIVLERGVCLGSCPSYTVQIAGDGSVIYQGRACVAVRGEQRARIAADAVRGLVARFRDLDFFTLRGRYASEVTDHPTTTTSIAFDGRGKSVVDYVGLEAGMPRGVAALEDAIDAAAGTERWVGGEKRPCRG